MANLSLAIKNVSTADIREKLSQADIVLVSGGNTLFARDRWSGMEVYYASCSFLLKGSVGCARAAGRGSSQWHGDGRR